MILVMGFDLATYIQQHKHNGFLQLHSFPDNLKMKYNKHVPLHYMEEIFYGLHQPLKGRQREVGRWGGGRGRVCKTKKLKKNVWSLIEVFRGVGRRGPSIKKVWIFSGSAHSVRDVREIENIPVSKFNLPNQHGSKNEPATLKNFQ